MLQLLAIDAGGTSTRAMVLTSDGECLGVGRGGRGNPVSQGEVAAASAIGTAVAAALSAASRTTTRTPETTAVTLAMAGGSTVTSGEWLGPTLHALGVDSPVFDEADLHAIYCSGTAAMDGYGLVAGTGATGVRVRGGNVNAFSDGLGWLLGDAGSGFWIGHQIARAVAADLDGRGESTSLTKALVEQLGGVPPQDGSNARAAALAQLVSAVYRESPLRVATFAPLAFADATDAVSVRIANEAVSALAQLVLHLRVEGLAGPLVIGGGVASQPRVAEPLLATIAAGGISGPVFRVEDGLVGAGVLGLRRAGVAVDAEVLERLQVTTAAKR